MLKRNLIFLILLCSFAFLSCVSSSCSKIPEANKENVIAAPEIADIPEDKDLLKNEYFQNTFIEPQDFFTPDYTPFLPEEIYKEQEKQLLQESTEIPENSTQTSDAENTKSIIPGLRDINDYETSYNTNMAIAADKLYNDTITGSIASNGSISSSDNEDFEIVTWGPQKTIPAAIRQPEFYVMFSEPVVPIAALGSEITSTDILTITPPIKGVYRWNGTSTLSFIPSEPVEPQQSYKLTISDSLTSLSGKPIKGEKEFSTTSEELKIIWSSAGYKYRESHFEYFSRNNVPPEAAKEFRVQFNYMVDADNIAKNSVITAGNKTITDFSVTQESSDTVTYNINEELLPETKITVTVAGTATDSYNTVYKFGYDDAYPGSSYGELSNPLYIYFSHPVNPESVKGNIKTSLDYEITEKNIKVNDATVILHGLPVTFNSFYKVTLLEGIEDIYGRHLGKTEIIDVEVPDADSIANFTDYGTCILEAKYPHAIVFEHQNVLDSSKYSLSKTDTPLDTMFREDLMNKDDTVKIVSEPKNQRILERVDLDPYLTDGKGMVRFQAKTEHPIKRDGKQVNTYSQTNVTTVQVTDLGVTARFGINKAAILVSKLSDGTAVQNANVYIYNGRSESVTEGKKETNYLATAVTDENGVAVLEYDPQTASVWFANDYNHPVSPAILVTTNDDAVTFYPKSHSPWRNGIYSSGSLSSALSIYPKTFMFSDRGLYKPGETITFRGIDKNLNLGTYIPYKGRYKITIKDNNWNVINPEESENLEGTTSDNGGFYGSFTFPEDSEPGNYSIIYERVDSSVEQQETLSVTVSYFQRLKFQTSVSIPETTIIAGEPVQGTLSASYLAGGVLASAAYNASWYSEPWYFENNNPAFKDYRFGPLNNYENMTYLSNDNGTLNGLGKTVLTCETTKQSVKGSAYRYRVSANVTDVSNQQISASAAVIVHPASYYIGITKELGKGYLVKKGDELKFDYKLSMPDCSEAENINTIASSSKKLKVELLREEWNTVQQQGINGNIYPRYVKETVTESEENYDLALKGTISVTPSEVGYYTLRLSSKDSKDRDVITEYSFFATGSTNSWVMNSTEATLKLTPNQNLYNPGDTATILLESPLPKGNYLITVEREGIFTEEVRTFDSAVNTIEIPVARNYVPVCYVSVASYSVRTKDPENQYGVADVDKPKGYYGVTAIHVNPYVKAFSVDIKTEKKAYKPGEEATITVTATKGGKPLENAEITLMAVDRGVLDLIDYHVANPIEYFYNEENFPLRVRGGDNRDYLMDPVTYAVKNLAGGDSMVMESEEMASKLNERKDFNPTALFEPVLVTDENGKATCTFKLPDSLTTYRITAFGVKDELLALEENEFKVQNPINVQQVTPRRLRERDTSELGIILTNLDSLPHEVNISLKTVSPENIDEKHGIKKQPGKAFVDGDSEHVVTVLPNSTIAVYFDVAAEKAGIINTEFTITSDILNEKLIYPLTIEKPYIFEQVTSTGAITGDNTKTEEGIIIPSFAENGLGSLSLTLDATRLGPLGSAVKYVFDYPYGCLEQQSSRILPLIIFEDYIDIFNMELDEKITNIHSFVTSYFSDWSKNQLSDGGFGYWPTSTLSSYYVSSRIAHTYATAIERGYTSEELKIDIAALTNFLWNRIMEDRNAVKESDKYLSSYETAYIQYVISIIDPEKIKTSDLDIILDNENSTISELAFGGLTALELDNRQLAEKFKTEISKYLRPNTQSVDITNNDNNYYWSMYNNTVEHLALTLKLYTELDSTDPMVTKLIFTLLKNQQQGYWQNTANTARVFDAFYSLIKTSDLDNLNLKASVSINDNKLAEGSFTGPAAQPVKETYMFNSPELKNIKAGTLMPVEFSKEGKGDLYFTTSMKYAIPYELQIPRDEGLSVVYKLYDDVTGEEITFDNESSSLVKLESGKTYRMDITLSSSKDRTYLALRAPIPSGAEILDATFVTTPDGSSTGSGRSSWELDNIDDGYYSGSYYMDNQTILDNEVQFFWNYFAKGTTKATFKFRAARRGVFPTPPVTAECMYESEIFGRTYGSLYTIQ